MKTIDKHILHLKVRQISTMFGPIGFASVSKSRDLHNSKLR
jgi:hypothetical protein